MSEPQPGPETVSMYAEQVVTCCFCPPFCTRSPPPFFTCCFFFWVKTVRCCIAAANTVSTGMPPRTWSARPPFSPIMETTRRPLLWCVLVFPLPPSPPPPLARALRITVLPSISHLSVHVSIHSIDLPSFLVAEDIWPVVAAGARRHSAAVKCHAHLRVCGATV